MTKNNHLTTAREVLCQEAKSLELLAESLGDSFNQALEIILESKGRLAVTGIGKSGYVARKVAATLSSTGTPSFFIHPVEAGHGDLGMLARNQDVLMAYSNSGQTSELGVILQFCVRYSIKIIGVTKDPESLLGKNSDVVIALPDLLEACPLGCAPTTSTTMMMALGDALALSLLSARGFTLEDFRRYHPGGKLGSRLNSVGDLMRVGPELPLVAPTDQMSHALLIMTKKRLGCLGIVKDEKLIGMITDGDLRRHMGPNLLETSAQQIMTASPTTFSPETLAAKALATMQTKGITNAFVLNQDQVPIGVIHIHDILAAGVT
ncbi:MAG: KpsF/GutQ family sugar-phosphate isomerase [Deltaproteobacteria bacterium]|jgi:arabinose-5-phosphate isomerase|nr:KpsF/GutQ family sugar-phosphate isomerase [Deltaproteobacteria bacterium]